MLTLYEFLYIGDNVTIVSLYRMTFEKGKTHHYHSVGYSTNNTEEISPPLILNV